MCGHLCLSSYAYALLVRAYACVSKDAADD